MRWLAALLVLAASSAFAQQVPDPASRSTVRQYSTGSQVPATQYNAAETQFYASPSGSDGNTCLSGNPCLTIKRALDAAMATDARGGSLVINLAAGTYNENVTVSGVAPGLANAQLWTHGYSHPQVILRGASAATTEIVGVPVVAGQGYCYTIFANSGAYLGLEKLSVRSDAGGGPCGQSNLYAQLATMYVLSDVTLKAATGNLVMLEESANFYVTPGTATPGLTLAGNATYGVVSAANSMFASDSTINITGPITMSGGLLFFADEQSVIKLALGNPAVTSGAAVTGRRFGLYGNSYMTVGHPPAVWPGTLGIVAEGSRYHSTDNQACAGGSAGCINATGPTGLGAGTIAIAGGSGAYGGIIELTAGVGAAASGAFGVGFPYEFDRVPGSATGAACTATLADGTGTWNAGASAKRSGPDAAERGGFSGPTGLSIAWDNTVPLTAGLTYFAGWVCNTTR